MAAWGRGQEAVRSISTPRERRLQKPDLWTQLLSHQSAHHRVSSVVLEPSQDCATVSSRAFRHPASAVTPTAARPLRAVTQAPSTGSRLPWTITRAGRTLWPWLPLPHPPTEGGASSPAMSPALGLRCRRGVLHCSDKPRSPVPSPAALSLLWTRRAVRTACVPVSPEHAGSLRAGVLRLR